LPITEVLLVLSIAAIFVASIIAVFETNLKRMLAYSSVAQIGYITLGIALANQTGLTGGLVHLFNHAVMKAGLFLALGAVVFRLGTVRIDELAGLGRKMPLMQGSVSSGRQAPLVSFPNGISRWGPSIAAGGGLFC
jgi:multicomponent Na+:H+ antiporter subunit D